MVEAGNPGASPTASSRPTLSEFEYLGLAVVRPCAFSYPAKILTPADDILVPLVSARAVADLLARAGISGVIATPELADAVPATLGLAIANDPLRVHHQIHLALSRMPGRLRQDAPTFIAPGAAVHPTAWVAPRNVHIGEGVTIMPGAIVHEHSVIGRETRVHAHAVIGGDAYEIIMLDGEQELRPQTGGVVIGNRCEIMSGAIVTRSAFCGATAIADRVVLDANVVVSHDCRIEEDVRVGGSSWLGGRVTVGHHASVGPNVTIGNGLVLGPRSFVSIGAVVTRDVAADERVSGNFAIEHARFIEHIRRMR